MSKNCLAEAHLKSFPGSRSSILSEYQPVVSNGDQIWTITNLHFLNFRMKGQPGLSQGPGPMGSQSQAQAGPEALFSTLVFIYIYIYIWRRVDKKPMRDTLILMLDESSYHECSVKQLNSMFLANSIF